MMLVDATADHLRQFYGLHQPKTCRAWAVIDGDRVLGLCGFYRKGIGNLVFTEISPELRAHPRLIILAARCVMAELRTRRMPIFAICDFSVEASERFLKHFGFAQLPNGIFQWLE